jgi:hypothetical protein
VFVVADLTAQDTSPGSPLRGRWKVFNLWLTQRHLHSNVPVLRRSPGLFSKPLVKQFDNVGIAHSSDLWSDRQVGGRNPLLPIPSDGLLPVSGHDDLVGSHHVPLLSLHQP